MWPQSPAPSETPGAESLPTRLVGFGRSWPAGPQDHISHSATPDRKFHVGSVCLQSNLVRGRRFVLAVDAPVCRIRNAKAGFASVRGRPESVQRGGVVTKENYKGPFECLFFR